jgi:hypothetical protein
MPSSSPALISGWREISWGSPETSVESQGVAPMEQGTEYYQDTQVDVKNLQI